MHVSQPRSSSARRLGLVRSEHTTAIGRTALLYGIAGSLELLERHFAVLWVQKDVPVLIAHGVWLAGGIAVFAVDVSEE